MVAYFWQIPLSIEMGTLHYPQMPPSVKNGGSTGSIFSANAAICEVRDISGSILSENEAGNEKRGEYW